MKKVCIQTLTHDAPNRADALKYTVKTFADAYSGPKIEWFFLFNGINDDLLNVLTEIKEIHKDKFIFESIISEINLGVGAGINKLNDLTKDYEYVFLLEGDWITLPTEMSGHSTDWFWNSIKLMDENPHLDQIHFRKYMDDVDDRQYGYHFWINDSNVDTVINNGDKFLVLKKREYTNNPSLRRLKSLYDKKVFPLNEYFSKNGEALEIKGNVEWGMAEIEAAKINEVKTAWLFLGNFIHYEFWDYKDDFLKWKKDNFGCNKYEMPGWNSCKYGYIFSNDYFCSVCKKSETMSDLNKHNFRYEQEIIPLKHSQVDHKIILEKIKEINDEPVIDIDNDIDVDLYLNNRLIRKKNNI